ncbi:MAG TPA: hypothetical protein VK971_02420 [Thiohalobacter sp.]|nr:hypothetical protein [Thiohalobacter sp.]
MDGLLFNIYERLMTLLDHAACRDDDPLHALDRIFDSHLGFVIGNPAAAKLLRHVLGRPHPRMRVQIEKIMRLYEREVVVLVQEAKIKGLVVDEVDSEAVATVFVSLIQAQALRLQILADAEAVRNEAHRAWRVFANSIRAD